MEPAPASVEKLGGAHIALHDALDEAPGITTLGDTTQYNDEPRQLQDPLLDTHDGMAALSHSPQSRGDSELLSEDEQLRLVSLNKEVSWLLGLLAVLVSCVLSGFSGVYFERLVKRSRQTSILIRNIQLGESFGD